MRCGSLLRPGRGRIVAASGHQLRRYRHRNSCGLNGGHTAGVRGLGGDGRSWPPAVCPQVVATQVCLDWCRSPGSNRDAPCGTEDFKSPASAIPPLRLEGILGQAGRGERARADGRPRSGTDQVQTLPGIGVAERKTVEATAGVEPANEGFADPCLTTWLRRLREKAARRRPSLRQIRRLKIGAGNGT